MQAAVVNLGYVLASVLFIFGLKGLAHPRSAVQGNALGALGMLLAVGLTLLDSHIISFQLLLVGLIIGTLLGAVLAMQIQMTAMPQLVALFNGFGGGASALVAGAALVEAIHVTGRPPVQLTIATLASGSIGALTFWGSLSPGFAGIPNPLFAADTTLMLFGDGKQMVLELINAVEEI